MIALSPLSSSVEVTCVSPKNVGAFWGTVEPLLAEAMEYSNFETTGDLLCEIEKGKALLWVVHTGSLIEAALVTQLKIDKRGKFLSIWALAGENMEHWIHLHEEIAAFAKYEGCNRMVHGMRPGFAKVMMKKFGYRMSHATIEKAI